VGIQPQTILSQSNPLSFERAFDLGKYRISVYRLVSMLLWNMDPIPDSRFGEITSLAFFARQSFAPIRGWEVA